VAGVEPLFTPLTPIERVTPTSISPTPIRPDIVMTTLPVLGAVVGRETSSLRETLLKRLERKRHVVQAEAKPGKESPQTAAGEVERAHPVREGADQKPTPDQDAERRLRMQAHVRMRLARAKQNAEAKNLLGVENASSRVCSGETGEVKGEAELAGLDAGERVAKTRILAQRRP
jgi:hypothetical protein